MTVYVDDAYIPYGRMKMCHMIADTNEELHAMADAIGLQRRWFQFRASWPHYDVSMSLRRKAVDRGAVELTRRELVGKIREYRAAVLAARHKNENSEGVRKV